MLRLFGPILEHFGRRFGASWGLLGPPGALLGASWALLGRSWGALGEVLDSLGAVWKQQIEQSHF